MEPFQDASRHPHIQLIPSRPVYTPPRVNFTFQYFMQLLQEASHIYYIFRNFNTDVEWASFLDQLA